MAEAEEQVKATTAGQGKGNRRWSAGPWEGARGGAGLLEGQAGQGGRAPKGHSGAETRVGCLFLEGTWESHRHTPGVCPLSLFSALLPWPVLSGLKAAWATTGTDCLGN